MIAKRVRHLTKTNITQMVFFKRKKFKGRLSIPRISEEISEEMLSEVSESDRRTFRVSPKVHKSWTKYRGVLTVNQYLCLVTMFYETYVELVESYQNGEIDEIEFTKAIIGDRKQEKTEQQNK